MNKEYESFNLSKALAEYIINNYGIGWDIQSVDISNNKVYLSKQREVKE